MNLATMTDEEIQIAINAYYEEQQRRKRIKLEKAINEFHHAFAKCYYKYKVIVDPELYEEDPEAAEKDAIAKSL